MIVGQGPTLMNSNNTAAGNGLPVVSPHQLSHQQLGMNGYYKLKLRLDKRYNTVALVQSELGTCSSCPFREGVFKNIHDNDVHI